MKNLSKNENIKLLDSLQTFSPCFITLYLDKKIELSTIYIEKKEIINISRKDIEYLFYHGKIKFYALRLSDIIKSSNKIILEDKFDIEKFNN